jgi:putative ABC transport system permease protein
MKERLSVDFMLAWRNVWKNKRRTILTLLTIAVGSAMVIFFIALQEGTYDTIIENAVSANTAHIQIHEKGFWENQSIDYAFIPDKSMIEVLRRDESIAAFTQRVHAAGLISSNENNDIAIIQGVDPASELRVSALHKAILKGGRYLKSGDMKQIVIGEKLAKNLGLQVGDSVSILSQGFDGSFAGMRDLQIVGIFRSGNVEYDRTLVLMPLAKIIDKFSMDKFMTSIAIRLQDGTRMPEVRDRLRKLIPNKDLEIMGWDELMPELMQYVVMDRTSAYIFYFVLYLTVAFGVLNTIQMSVYERTREFGVMLAIGTRPNQILSMVLIESFLISVMGVILGAVVGSVLGYYFTVYPIDYTEYQKELEVWGFTMTKVPAKLAFSYILETSIVIFIISMLFTLIPARRAARLNPISAIRKL